MDKYEQLNDTFDVTPVEVEKVKSDDLDAKLSKFEGSSEDIRKDYEYTRGNLYSIIEKGQEAINGILEIAQESEMPRAYEVAGQLIKNVSDATDKLLDLQKKLKDVNEEKDKPTNVTNNALFVGSTADLQKMLKNVSKETK
jgi:hypothetical protein